MTPKIKLIISGVLLVGVGIVYVGFTMPMSPHTGAGKVSNVERQRVRMTRTGSSHEYEQFVYKIDLDGESSDVLWTIGAAPDVPPTLKIGQPVNVTWRRSGLFGKQLATAATAR